MQEIDSLRNFFEIGIKQIQHPKIAAVGGEKASAAVKMMNDRLADIKAIEEYIDDLKMQHQEQIEGLINDEQSL